MSHKFHLGQVVRFVRAPISDRRVSGAGEYEIVRLMPADVAGEISYRIRMGATERAVREFEIRT